MATEAVLAIFLIVATYMDIKKRRINLLFSILFTFIAVCINGISLFRGTVTMQEIFLSTFPGILLLIIAWMTNQSIGMGDGVVVVIIGLFIGFKKTVVIIMSGFMISMVFCIILIVFKRVNKNYELPFIPVLALATLLIVIQTYIS